MQRKGERKKEQKMYLYLMQIYSKNVHIYFSIALKIDKFKDLTKSSISI